MKTVMMTLRIFFTTLCALSTAVVAADNAIFDPSTGNLHIPVVEIPPPFSGFYTVNLQIMSGSGYNFSLSNATPTTETGSSSDILYTTVSPSDIGNMLNSLNIVYEIKTTSNGTPYIFATLNNAHKMVIFFSGCNNWICQNIELWGGFDYNPSLELMNNWNVKHRNATALTFDNTSWLSMHLDIKPGVTSNAIKTFVLTFQSLLPEYKIYLTSRSRASQESEILQFRDIDNDFMPIN